MSSLLDEFTEEYLDYTNWKRLQRMTGVDSAEAGVEALARIHADYTSVPSKKLVSQMARMAAMERNNDVISAVNIYFLDASKWGVLGEDADDDMLSSLGLLASRSHSPASLTIHIKLLKAARDTGRDVAKSLLLYNFFTPMATGDHFDQVKATAESIPQLVEVSIPCTRKIEPMD